jgi:hypothetical protein
MAINRKGLTMDFTKISLTHTTDIRRNEDHQYFVNGEQFDSVTQILHSHLGIEYYHNTDFYKERGSEVDRCIGLLLDGVLDWDSMDSRIAPYISQFKEFIKITGFNLLAHNQYIYHPYLKYAGEFDLLGTLIDNPEELILLDVKTGAKMPHYKLQTAGYGEALRYSFNELKELEYHRVKRYGLYLSNKENRLYRLDHHAEPVTDNIYWRGIAHAHRAKGIYK